MPCQQVPGAHLAAEAEQRHQQGQHAQRTPAALGHSKWHRQQAQAYIDVDLRQAGAGKGGCGAACS